MAWWIYVPKPDGGMPGLLGPYTGFRAQRIADKLEDPHELVQTVSENPAVAKREIKEKMIERHGYFKGSKRIHLEEKGYERTSI